MKQFLKVMKDSLIKRFIFIFLIYLPLYGISKNWNQVMDAINDMPVINIFFLVLTVLLIILAFPLYKRLQGKP